MSDLIGKDVDMVYATRDGVRGTGKVIGYCDAPSYIIELPDGTRTSWRADLTQLAAPTVQLPSVPTLGWLATLPERAPELGVWSAHAWPRSKPTYRSALQRERDVDAGLVTGFTPATAVPTEVLDALRAARRKDQSESGLPQGYEILCTAVREFLEAVDEAGAR